MSFILHHIVAVISLILIIKKHSISKDILIFLLLAEISNIFLYINGYLYNYKEKYQDLIPIITLIQIIIYTLIRGPFFISLSNKIFRNLPDNSFMQLSVFIPLMGIGFIFKLWSKLPGVLKKLRNRK